MLTGLARLKACFPDIVDLEAVALAQNMTGDKGEAFMTQSNIIVDHASADKAGVDINAVDALQAGLPLIKKLRDKAKFAQDEEARAKAWKEFGLQVAKHSLNVRNYVSERIRIVRDEAEERAGNLARDGQRIGDGYREDLKEGGNKIPAATAVAALAGALGLLVSPWAVPVAIIAILLPTSWAQFPSEIEEIKKLDQDSLDEDRENDKDGKDRDDTAPEP